MIEIGAADKLLVFQKAYPLAIDIHRLTQDFPRNEQYGGVADQLRRSSKSVCANLVEGAGRQALGHRADFRRFVVIAMGSADETRLWLRFASDLGFLEQDQAEALLRAYVEISKMLSGLSAALSKN